MYDAARFNEKVVQMNGNVGIAETEAFLWVPGSLTA